MKHDKFIKILLWSLLAILLIAIIVSVFVVVKLYFSAKFNDFFVDFCKFSIQTLIGTFIVGGCVKLITNKFIKITKNNSALKRMGIQNIQPSTSTPKDEIDMFGCKELGDYPKEIGFMFITGCVFIDVYKYKLFDAIMHGSNVKVLVAEYDKQNNCDSNFLSNANDLCDQGSCPYYKQITYKTIPIVKEIRKMILDEIVAKIKKETANKDGAGDIVEQIKSKTQSMISNESIVEKFLKASKQVDGAEIVATEINNTTQGIGNIEIEFYTNEYRYNYRYAKYAYDSDSHKVKKANKYVYKMWANVQPGNKDAVNMSIALKGEYSTDASAEGGKREENLLYSQYLCFNKVWDKYSYTKNDGVNDMP